MTDSGSAIPWSTASPLAEKTRVTPASEAPADAAAAGSSSETGAPSVTAAVTAERVPASGVALPGRHSPITRVLA